MKRNSREFSLKSTKSKRKLTFARRSMVGREFYRKLHVTIICNAFAFDRIHAHSSCHRAPHWTHHTLCTVQSHVQCAWTDHCQRFTNQIAAHHFPLCFFNSPLSFLLFFLSRFFFFVGCCTCCVHENSFDFLTLSNEFTWMKFACKPKQLFHFFWTEIETHFR